MKFKKITSAVVSCMLAGAVFTGCGGDTNKPVSPSEDNLKIGMITTLNASEQKMDEILKKVGEISDVKIATHSTTYYDNLNNMIMGIDSGSVNEISTYKSVAEYLTAKDSKFEILKSHSLHLKDSFCFALRDDEKDLKKDIDKALEELKADGTLDKLTKEYITDLKKDSDPPAVNLESISGAETLKVAVTGDLPPLDLILADGKAAGFNTALLAELGKKLNKNIELVQVDSAARGSALTSQKVDVVFWAILPIGDDRPSDIDMPKGVEFSEPYFTDEIVHLDKKK